MNAKNGINIEIYNKNLESPYVDIRKNKNTILTNQWVRRRNLRKLENSFRLMRNRSHGYQNMTAKAILRGKLTAIYTIKRFQNKSLAFYLKTLEGGRPN